METKYPLVPKSTSRLRRGQFWSIPLSDGRFGAGCVLGGLRRNNKKDARGFIAGVANWIGVNPPTEADLDGVGIYRHAFAHIKCITETGASIIGEANLEYGGIPEVAESLSISTWGYGVPVILAHKLAGLQLTTQSSGPAEAGR
jgi:hypothetical protein